MNDAQEMDQHSMQSKMGGRILARGGLVHEHDIDKDKGEKHKSTKVTIQQ